MGSERKRGCDLQLGVLSLMKAWTAAVPVCVKHIALLRCISSFVLDVSALAGASLVLQFNLYVSLPLFPPAVAAEAEIEPFLVLG